MESDAEKRGCYCGLWEKDPDVLRKQGLPEGYCGLCDVCGKPGHTRHFPGTSPVTGAWCDRHYRMVSVFHPLGHFGKYFYGFLGLLLLIAYTFWKKR